MRESDIFKSEMCCIYCYTADYYWLKLFDHGKSVEIFPYYSMTGCSWLISIMYITPCRLLSIFQVTSVTKTKFLQSMSLHARATI